MTGRKFSVARDGARKAEGRRCRARHGSRHSRSRRARAVFRRCRRRSARAEGPERIVAYVFDLLHLDGKDLTALPLTERKEKLEKLLEEIKPGSSFCATASILPAKARRCSPRPASRDWRASSRSAPTRPTSRAGRKLAESQMQLRQEFIIIGYSDAKSGGRALGALYLGYKRTAPCAMPARSARASR